jgi:hypothetical protein
MHGEMPTLRARKRPKKSVDSWLTPQQQFEAALKLIQPIPERRTDCEAQILATIENIHDDKTVEKKWLEEQKQAPRRKLAKKLRAVEVAGAGLLDEFVLGLIKGQRKYFERQLKRLNERHRRGGIRQSLVKGKAAYRSWLLLNLYRRDSPVLTEGGLWHQLAAILFGCTEVGSFNFDYLRHFWDQICKGPYGADFSRKKKLKL